MPRAVCAVAGLIALVCIGCSASTTEGDVTASSKGASPELAMSLIDSEQYDAALDVVRKGLAKHPRDGALHHAMGLILRHRGLYQEAEDSFQLAMRHGERKNPALHEDRGIGFSEQARYPEAIEAFERSLALQKDRFSAYNNLGFAHFSNGDAEAAVEWYRKSLRYKPDHKRTYNNLGFALAALGDFRGAGAAFAQGGPEDDALTNLGIAYELAEKPKEARRAYQQALYVNPNAKKPAKRLRELDTKHPAHTFEVEPTTERDNSGEAVGSLPQSE